VGVRGRMKVWLEVGPNWTRPRLGRRSVSSNGLRVRKPANRGHVDRDRMSLHGETADFSPPTPPLVGPLHLGVAAREMLRAYPPVYGKLANRVVLKMPSSPLHWRRACNRSFPSVIVNA
jgi:hypothetical protein